MASNIIPVTATVQNLECGEAFSHLTDKEKNYAYFMSKASWAGAKMVLHQLCYEAPPLFLIFQAFFQEKDFHKVQEAALAAGVSAEDYQRFIAYVAGTYSNMCNYQSFGHNKFIPEINSETFLKILHSNPLFTDEHALYKTVIEELWPQVEKEIFSIESPYSVINFPEEGGITGYFGRNLKKDDLKNVTDFITQRQGVDVLNTRAFKKEDGTYVVTVGSVDAGKTEKGVEYNGNKFDVIFGEFAPYVKECHDYMQEVLKYAANETQEKMVEKYIEHFQTGDMDAHRDSQRHWVKDKGPVVESNIGWIETYIDPTNERGYFEGWVAVVDKPKSEKFQNLVKNSEHIIPKLPWPKEMEKEKFLAPDFTTLEVICFAANGCPLGINIPNYDDIRETEGFKNVYLGNAMPTIKATNIQFATPEQSAVLAELTASTYVVHVACHELLGHGTGKLIYRDADGKASKFTDPITKEEYESCYEEGDTWNSRFGSISASYEECRADTVGYFLCTLQEVYSLFGVQDADVDKMLWVNVMSQLRKGIIGLPLYNADAKKWGQAHTQGAYVFTQWIYQNQKGKIVHFEITGDNDFVIHLDEALLISEGKGLISQLLVVLQTYKSSGALERGKKFYDEYSDVNGIFLEIRDIVLRNKKPRRLELNNNLVRYSDKSIAIQHYPETHEGIIHSYADRHQFTHKLYKQVKGIWDEHKDHLRV